MATKGFKTVENKIEHLMEMLDPPKQDPVIIDLIETYGVNGNDNDVIRIAIQPDTRETFLVVEDDNFDFHL